MKHILGILIVVLMTACQPKITTTNVNIIDREKIFHFQTNLNTPQDILEQAKIGFSAADKILYHGVELPIDFSLPPGGFYTLQILRAHTLTLVTPDNSTSFRTTSRTVGQALAQTGLQVFSADFFNPSLDTPITSDLIVSYRPARDLTVIVDGENVLIKSSKVNVGKALAGAGLGLAGLDTSVPDATENIPLNGQIQIVRSRESLSFKETPIPFSNKYEYSTDLAAGEQKVVQVGQQGLLVSRVRTRFNNGTEVSSVVETETLVRQPKDAVITLSTQVQINSINTPTGPVQYWRAVQMYATSYSPCRSGTSACHNGTASGLPVKHGVVAVIRSLYNQLAGTQVYIPGYGVGVIGDIGGGFPDGRLWIDLGYSDDDFQSWSGFYTVYFLAPAPASIPAGLE